MELKLSEKEIFYLRVLLMEEITRLENLDRQTVFRGPRLSIYMKLYEQLEKIQLEI